MIQIINSKHRLEHLNFEFKYCLGFRYSDFGFNRLFRSIRSIRNFIFLFTCLFFIFPLKTFALSFDPSFIISDYELTNYQFLTQEKIQSFLKDAEGTLDTYETIDLDNKKRLASEIIFNASQKYKINPAVILTIVQKEKTLVTHQDPSDDHYNWATGFGCYDEGGSVKKFRGFARQIDQAAWRLRYFLEHSWLFRFKQGQTYKIDDIRVSPLNQATAALYNYTPHPQGNKLFWQIWQKWFTPLGEESLEGFLVRAKGEPGVWLIQNDKRRPFHSKNVFLTSFSFNQVKEINHETLEKYEIGEVMTFPNYSLAETKRGGFFLLANNQKRPLTIQMFKKIGFHPEEVIKVEEADLTNYMAGDPIISPYPSGVLLQDKKTNAVYYVKDDIKYPIINKVILETNFPYDQIIKTEPKELTELKTGEPFKLQDGSLIKLKNEQTVFLISNGKRLPIFSQDTFELLGYEFKSVITVSSQVLELHPLGETIKIQS